MSVLKNNPVKYNRKEWMHPDDLDFNSPSNHVMYLKHLKAYEHAFKFVEGKKVLEIGCGSGYGNKLLAKKADKIYTVDFDEDSLAYAKEKNFSSNVEYIKADVTKGVDLEDSCCDLCVCFQVIEHIDEKNMSDFINEIKRIVKQDGLIMFTTPNRKIRLYPFQKPVNKYHKTEYTGSGLKKLLVNYFKSVEVFGMQAIPELKEIEINRSKASLFKHFILFPAKRFLGIEGPIISKSKIKSFNAQDYKKSDKYVTSNFWLDEKVPNDSIDLMAHCVNP